MKKILPILLLFFSISLIAQKKKIEESYQEYFKIPREAIFVHTNKTTYLTGEEIWLKAYAFDKKNSLSSLKTRNIYVGIYDSSGNQIDKKLLLGDNGSAKGNIKLAPTLTSGTYYLKASTNWMKNFKEDDSFVQKIEIINSKSPKDKNINKQKFDLQFLAEGGHIISGIKNTVGFKYLDDQGKGNYVSGSIFDQDNKLITNFKSNALGMGKFTFIPTKGNTYTAKFLSENGTNENVTLPKVEDFGITLNVNNNRNDRVIVSLLTNKESFETFSQDSLRLLIHRDGLLKSIRFKLSKQLSVIQLPKKELFKGINILTVVNSDDKPILERMIFNDFGFEKYPLTLSKTTSDFDSISYSLRSIKSLNPKETVSLSISVLPKQTKSYNPNHNIITALLIQPYIKTTIEKPSFYFKDFGAKDKYNLDIMLLTQGWSKYSWNDIKSKAPNLIYDFEEGLSFSGTINSQLRNVKSLILYPTKYTNSKFINFDEKGKFNFSNIYLEKGEKVSFSALTSNGKMKRPLININPIIKVGKDIIDTSNFSKSFSSYYTDKNEIPNNFITDGYEQLDEVNIVVKKKERLRDPQFPNAQITQITKDIAFQYPLVTDFIRNNGFDVFDGTTGGSLGIGLGKITIISRGGRGGGASPVLFIDGILTQDFNILQTLRMNNVDRVLIDKTGIGLGLSGGNSFGGVIKITTRKTSLISPNLTTPDIFSTKVRYGFEPVKEFYAPKYPSYRIQSFKNYGIIHWDPNASLSGFSNYNFRTINTTLNEVSFYIEGISSTGKLFSQVINLQK